MLRINRFVVALLSLTLVSGIMATVWQVPEDQDGIQAMIDDTLVVNGDTVSVWVHTVPPDTYRENVNFDGKSIFVVNRSFLGGTALHDSSWNWVVIDSQHNGPTPSKSRR